MNDQTSGIQQKIDEVVKTNDIVLFMKGTPQMPQCGFSSQVVQILDYIGAEYKSVNVLANDIVLFMKGTPQMPQCGFSSQVVQILDYIGAEYKSVNVLANEEVRQGIKEYSNWPTIPQLYVKGEFVGGCDIIREMFQAGELSDHFAQAGIQVSQPSQS